MSGSHFASIIARSILPDKDSDTAGSGPVCPAEPADKAIVPIFGSMTYHTFSSILSGACAIFSIIIIFIAVARHATNYSSPLQQRQIIRILFLVPWVSIWSFLIVRFPNAGEYMAESLDVGCAIAISGFLLLMCDYVLSNQSGYEALFGAGASNRVGATPQSPAWFRRCWYAVLQFIPTSIILWIVTAASLAAGTFCYSSNSVHFAHIWVSVIKVIVTGAAVISVLRFYRRMKEQLSPHKVFLKFFAFKGIIGLNVLQTFVINILVGHSIISPTSHLTYADISVGLPSLILSCEMPIFASLMLFSFSASPYQGKSPGAGPVTAVVEALNIADLLSAFVSGPMRLVRDQSRALIRQASMPLASDGIQEQV